MRNELTRRETPEERELARKRSELIALEGKLAEAELELTTLQVEVRDFEGQYIRIVGSRYAELDEIEAEIAERLAAAHPRDPHKAQEAAKARDRADESADTVGRTPASPRGSDRFVPSDRLKDLYRKAAKAMHPDLATDPEDRSRRQRQMSEVNRAYHDGDETKLEEILRQWQSSPESVKGDGPGAELVRTIRKIAQVEERLASIAAETARLKESDVFKLRTKVAVAQEQERDLFAEMAADLEVKIREAKERLRRCSTPEGQAR